MKHDLIAAGVLFLAGLLALPQEPQRTGQEPERPAPPPAGAQLLPAIEEPYVSPVPRLDLLQRFDRPDPIEGLYELRTRMLRGALDPRPGRGFLVIGKRHLVLYLMGAGADPATPQLRAGVRKWQRRGETLQLTVVAGHYTDKREVVVEPAGKVETRRIEVTSGGLRIFQDDQNWLEFVRIE
jgi:hypothetical protein